MDAELRERFDSLIEKMDALGRADPECRVFGASEHRWARLEPLGEEEVGRLEAERNVRLPEDYRYYIAAISAGGAGPYYGLVPPGQADEWLRRHVGEAAPLWGAPFQPMRAVFDEPDENEEEPDDEDFDEIARPGPHGYDGCMFVSMQGCGYFSVLVLTGEHSKEVWSETQDCGGALEPEAPSFLEWMEGWADRALLEWATQRVEKAIDSNDRSLLDTEALALARPLLEAQAVDSAANIVRTLALLCGLDGEYERAAKLIEAAASRETEEPEARLHLDRARLARLRDDFETVEREAAAVAGCENTWHSTKTRALCLRIEALSRMGRGEEALDVMEALAESCYFDLGPHLDVARAYADRHRWDDVERVLRRAAERGAGAPPGAKRYQLPLMEKATQVISPLLPWIDEHHPSKSDWLRELPASFDESGSES